MEIWWRLVILQAGNAKRMSAINGSISNELMALSCAELADSMAVDKHGGTARYMLLS